VLELKRLIVWVTQCANWLTERLEQ
jgi:hypothetical protein